MAMETAILNVATAREVPGRAMQLKGNLSIHPFDRYGSLRDFVHTKGSFHRMGEHIKWGLSIEWAVVGTLTNPA